MGTGTYGLESATVSDHRRHNGTWTGGRLEIGKYCSIAPVTFMLGGIHRSEWVTQYPFASVWGLDKHIEDARTNGDIVVGNDVWLSTGAMVLSGVTIGHGAVVAACAVVTRDVEPYAIVTGVPAATRRMRFDEATVHRLLEMAWWDWPEDEIRARWSELAREP